MEDRREIEIALKTGRASFELTRTIEITVLKKYGWSLEEIDNLDLEEKRKIMMILGEMGKNGN